MITRKDLTGQQFGRWTVLHYIETKQWPTGHKAYIWHCKCECGKEKDIQANHLTGSKSKSCGCLRAQIKTRKERPTTVRQVWYSYKAGAKKCNRVFELTEEQV